MKKTTRLNIVYAVDIADRGTKELLNTNRQIERSVAHTAKAMERAGRESAQAATKQSHATVQAGKDYRRFDGQLSSTTRSMRGLVTAGGQVEKSQRRVGQTATQTATATRRAEVAAHGVTGAMRGQATAAGTLARNQARVVSESHQVARSMLQEEAASKRAARAVRDQARAAAKSAADSRANAKRTAVGAAGLIRGPPAIAGLGAGAGLTAFVTAGVSFEKQMARVSAVSQSSERDLAALSKQAIQLGQDTQFSAREAADGMYQLATQGFNAQQIMKTMPGTLSLAAATATDLGEAASTQASVIRQFGLNVADAGHVADVLTASVNSSAIEISDLTETLSYVGPVAGRFNQSFEDMAGAAAILGNVGIKGSMAGTTLRRAFVSLIKPSKQTKAALEEAGVSMGEFQRIVNDPKTGKIRDLPSIFGDLAKEMQGATKPEMRLALARLFGTEALPGLLTLFSKGKKGMQDVSKQLQHSDGVAARTAHTMRNTVAGAWDQFTGSVETAAITLTKRFQPSMKGALLGAAGGVNDVTNGLLGGKGGSGAEKAGHAIRSAAVTAADAVRNLIVAAKPAAPFFEHVLWPILQTGAKLLGGTFLASLKLATALMSALAHVLGPLDDAAAHAQPLVTLLGIGFTLWAVRLPVVVGLVGRLGIAGKLLVGPLRVVSMLTASIFRFGGASAGLGLLARMRVAWLGVAAAETTAAKSGVAATAAATAGGARSGKLATTLSAATLASGVRGGGIRGGAAGAGVLARAAGGALLGVAPAVLGTMLVSGVISGVMSKRSDFGGKFQDFLSGATFGAVHHAGQSTEQRVRTEYTRAVNDGLTSAMRQVQRGAGFRALNEVLDARHEVALSGGNISGGNPRTANLNFNDLARRERTLAAQAATMSAGVDRGRAAQTGGRGAAAAPQVANLRQVRDELNRVRAAQAQFLKDAPKFVNVFAKRGDYSSLVQLRRELERTGKVGAELRKQLAGAAREARGAQFNALTRSLERGGARSLNQVRDAVRVANQSMAQKGLKPGDADFARNQASLAQAAAKNIKQLVKAGVVSADQGNKEIRRILRDTQIKTGQSIEGATKNGVKGLDGMVRGWVRGFGRVHNVTVDQVKKISATLDKMPPAARRNAAEAMVLMTRQLERGGKLPKGATDNLVLQLQTKFDNLGNLDDPVKDPLRRIRDLLNGLKGPGSGAADAVGAVKRALSGLIPKGLTGALSGVLTTLQNIAGVQLPNLGGLGLQLLTPPDKNRKRKGGLISTFQGGGLVPILAAGGEVLVDGDRASLIPGAPDRDETLLFARPGAAVLTGDGQARMAAGASLASAIATQLPHFKGGGQVPGGKYMSTAYGPPWNAMNGTGVTATGINLKHAQHRYIVAVDPRVIPLHSKVYAWPNPFGYRGAFGAEDTGGAIRGRRLDFYDWRGRGSQNRWGRRAVTAAGSAGAGAFNAAGQKLTSTSTDGPPENAYYAVSAKRARSSLRRLRTSIVPDAFNQGYQAGLEGTTGRDVYSGILPDLRERIKTPTVRHSVKSYDVKGGGAFKAGGGWAGTQNLVMQAIAGIGGRKTYKRSHAVNGNQNSDHNTWIKNAFATDISPGSDGIFSTLAHRLGIGAHKGSWNIFRNKPLKGFRSQLLWYAPDGSHRDHVHLGIRKMRRGGLVAPDGKPSPLNRVAAGFKAPLPPPGTIVQVGGESPWGTVAASGAASPTDRPPRIWLSGADQRYALAHELGHVVDYTLLSDRQRQRLKRLFGMSGPWRGTEAGHGNPPHEKFAEVYSLVARGMSRNQAMERGSLGYGVNRIKGRNLSKAYSMIKGLRGYRTGGRIVGTPEAMAQRRESRTGLTHFVREIERTGDLNEKRVKRLLEGLVAVIGEAGRYSVRKLESMQARIRAEISRLAKGGFTPSERTKVTRLRGVLALLDTQVGNRVGLAVAAIEQAHAQLEKDRTKFDQSLRLRGIDTASSGAQRALVALLGSQADALIAQRTALMRQLAIAQRHGDTAAIKDISDRVIAVQDEFAETYVQWFEAIREALRAAAQETTDAAQHLATMGSGGLGLLDAQQRLARGGREDSPGAMTARGDMISSTIVPALQGVGSALNNQLRVAMDTGATPDVIRGLLEAIQANQTEIISAMADSADLIRQAAQKTAEIAVGTAAFGTSITNVGFDALQLRQRLDSTFDSAGAAIERANYLREQLIPNLEKEREALHNQYLVLLSTEGADSDNTRQALLAELQKANEISQANLDANEATKENTDALREIKGSTGFEFGGQSMTDLSALAGALTGA